MADVSERVRKFIYFSIDSVELLEVLLLLRPNPAQVFTVQSVNGHLRSSEASIRLRLETLVRLGLVEHVDQDSYRFAPKDPEMNDIIAELSDANRIMRHRILELIFSPLKKARNFADAFVVGKPPGKQEDDNG